MEFVLTSLGRVWECRNHRIQVDTYRCLHRWLTQKSSSDLSIWWQHTWKQPFASNPLWIPLLFSCLIWTIIAVNNLHQEAQYLISLQSIFMMINLFRKIVFHYLRVYFRHLVLFFLAIFRFSFSNLSMLLMPVNASSILLLLQLIFLSLTNIMK